MVSQVERFLCCLTLVGFFSSSSLFTLDVSDTWSSSSLSSAGSLCVRRLKCHRHPPWSLRSQTTPQGRRFVLIPRDSNAPAKRQSGRQLAISRTFNRHLTSLYHFLFSRSGKSSLFPPPAPSPSFSHRTVLPVPQSSSGSFLFAVRALNALDGAMLLSPPIPPRPSPVPTSLWSLA